MASSLDTSVPVSTDDVMGFDNYCIVCDRLIAPPKAPEVKQKKKAGGTITVSETVPANDPNSLSPGQERRWDKDHSQCQWKGHPASDSTQPLLDEPPRCRCSKQQRRKAPPPHTLENDRERIGCIDRGTIAATSNDTTLDPLSLVDILLSGMRTDRRREVQRGVQGYCQDALLRLFPPTPALCLRWIPRDLCRRQIQRAAFPDIHLWL